MIFKEPEGADKKLVEEVSAEINRHVVGYIMRAIAGGMPQQHAFSIMSSAVVTSACSGPRAIAEAMGIPYTDADHQAFVGKVYKVFRAEDDRIRNLYTGASN